MTATGLTNAMRLTTLAPMAMLMLAGSVGGCVNISAPDKPIQINLNINVTQEVVYRLDNDAKSLIQQNPGIF
jgi:hypothetical protein|nr:YnbE family lipoprotein [Sphingomonas phyllosphaerae]